MQKKLPYNSRIKATPANNRKSIPKSLNKFSVD